MRLAICNEIFWTEDAAAWPFARQCQVAAELGYDAIEVSPFTFHKDVRQITDEQKAEIVQGAAAAGIEVAGIHWVLAHTSGLHVTDPDPAVRERTAEYMEDLVRFGVEIGGRVMVVGSPLQRAIQADRGVTYEQAWEWFRDCMARCGEAGAKAGFRICLEPLCSATGNNFLHRASEVRKLAREIAMPNVGLILDTYSGLQEEADLPKEIRATGEHLLHYHCNDVNGRAPGWGEVDFVPLMRALLDIRFAGYASIEVFDFSLDAVEHVTKGIETLRAAMAEAGG